MNDTDPRGAILSGKVALSTGAGRGIGRAMAMACGEAGGAGYITGQTFMLEGGMHTFP